MLEAPLTNNEITEALADFARSKSPGSDGLPIKLYLQYGELLTPKLLTLYNYVFENFELPPSIKRGDYRSNTQVRKGPETARFLLKIQNRKP